MKDQRKYIENLHTMVERAIRYGRMIYQHAEGSPKAAKE